MRHDDDHVRLTKRVSAANADLDTSHQDDEAAALAYEQVDGTCETNQTRYIVDQALAGNRLTIETSFEATASGLGSVLANAVLERQQEAEFEVIPSLIEEPGESLERVTQYHSIQMRVPEWCFKSLRVS